MSAPAAEAPQQGFWRETREAFRSTPGLGILIGVNLLGSFVAGLIIPVLPLFLFARGFSLFQLGGLFSLIAAGSVLVQHLAGRYPEAFGDRRAVLGLSFLQALQFVAYVFVTTPAAFLAVSAVGAFAGAAAAPGLQALIAEAAPVRSRARVFSFFGMGSSLAYAVAIVIAYALAGASFTYVFYLGALSALAISVLMLSLWIRALGQKPRVPRQRLTPATREALERVEDATRATNRAWFALQRARRGIEASAPRDPRAFRNLALVTAHVFLFGLSLAIYPVYFPIHLLELGLAPTWMGLVIASSWITFGACQPWGAHLASRTGRVRALIVASLALASLLNIVLALAPLPWVIAAWVLLGIADGLGRPVVEAIVADQATRAGRLAAYAWTQTATTTARVVAPYALAFFIVAQGVGASLLVVAVVVLLAAIPLALLQGVDRPRPAPAPAVPAGESP